MKPWEKYSGSSSGPWSKYANTAQEDSTYTYGQAALDTGKTIKESAGRALGNITFPLRHPVQTAKGLAQGVMHPIQTAKAVGQSIYQSYGPGTDNPDKVPNWAYTISHDPFKFVGDVAGAAGLAGGLRPKNFPATTQAAQKGASVVGKVAGSLKPTVYNDAFVSNVAKSAISKIENKINPIREQYKVVTQPFLEQPVDAETFQRALNVVPKSIRNDFLEEYGSHITDLKGRSQTTVGNLQRMELELKDFISRPDFGGKISAAEFNVAEAAKKLKELRMAQLPKEVQDQIKILDKKFAPVIQASNELLPKLADRNGVPNTEFLYRTFKNPAKAGMRDYMRNLKSVGIDLNPEIKNIRGWISRQGHKEFVKNNAGRVAEGLIIGGALKNLR